MGTRIYPFLVTVFVALLCAVCDFLLKRASGAPHPFYAYEFWIGLAGYTFSAFAWVYVLQHFTLASVGAIYCVSLVFFLAIGGVCLFREQLSATEYLGLFFAVAALILLSRFS